MKQRIAILYICLGNYYVMWDGFYNSAKQYLFTKHDIHFYCFTDNEKLLQSELEDVTFIKERNYGWPGNTLYRFKMFSSLDDELIKYDLVYFFNANAFFVEELNDEIMPEDKQTLVVAQHFKMQGLDPILYGYDRNKKSTAFVKWGEEGKDYVQACFIGALASEMIKMAKELSNNIDIDENNGIVAKWHDESHFNKYIIGKNYKLLPVSYVYPEVLELPIEVKILMRKKEQFGDLNVLRYGNKSLWRTIKEKTVFQYRKIQNYYHFLLKRIGVYDK